MSNSKAKLGEEDLDDLDDLLEQFTKPEISQQRPAAAQASSSSSTNLPSTSKSPGNDDLPDDFTKELAASMEEMLRAMTSNTTEFGSDTHPSEAEFREAWKRALIDDLEADGKGNALDTLLQQNTNPDGASANEPGKSGSEEDAFQKAIHKAMEKLQNSDDALKADSKGSQENLENLLSSLGKLKLDEDVEGGENLESMLEAIMSQLMSKEILYEPLKELDTKYPEYLAKHAESLSPEDLSRYTDQKGRVSQIIAIFENSSYSDDDVAQSTEILRLMNEMQSFGSPPSEIMGPMPPGFDLGQDGLPDGCIIA